VSCTSILVSHADQTTTGNLLNNPDFTTDTSGWELSDNNQDKVKRDPATYSDSASKSVRFRYQGGSISQDVDISGVSENHLIKEINMNFDSIGCGNSGSQWCNAGADDTVVSTITLSTESTSEVLSETVAVPYEDGWESYSFTKDVIGDFNTDDASLNLTITGNDTGNSSNWYGPIIDNLSLTLTTEQYVAPVVIEPIVEPLVVKPIVELVVIEPIVEPIVEPVIEPIVESVIEPIVVIEETLIEGISLDMSITNDIILDQPIAEITPIEMTVPDINIDMATDPDVPSIETKIPQQIEISVAPITSISVSNVENLAPINEVEEIQEIVEIELPEVVEVEVDAEMELEQPEELKEINMEEDLAEISDEENNNEPEETASNDGNDEKSELSESDVQESSSKEVNESKVVKKDKPKDDKKSKKNDSKKTTVEKQNSTTKSKTVVQKSKQKNQKNTVSVETLGQIILPNAYLQVLQDTIKITETLSIQQEMIYGQNAYDLVGFTFESSFGGDSPDRFDSLLGVQSRYQSPTYRRSGK
jgi:hypothetical protein